MLKKNPEAKDRTIFAPARSAVLPAGDQHASDKPSNSCASAVSRR